MIHTPERCQVITCLPITLSFEYSLYIKSTQDKDITWKTFVHPFSAWLWIMLILVALIAATILTALESYFEESNKSFIVLDYAKNVWICLRINFGGEPGQEHKNLTLKIIFLTCLFAGIIIWGAYQASLTSELSVVKLKLPFNDLESLHDSSYRLGGIQKVC